MFLGGTIHMHLYLQMSVTLLACFDDCNVVEDSKLVQV